MDGWMSCERPVTWNKWQRYVSAFEQSGDDCWGKDFGTSEEAKEASKRLRNAGKVLYERGRVPRIAVSKQGQWVYLMMSDEE